MPTKGSQININKHLPRNVLAVLRLRGDVLALIDRPDRFHSSSGITFTLSLLFPLFIAGILGLFFSVTSLHFFRCFLLFAGIRRLGDAGWKRQELCHTVVGPQLPRFRVHWAAEQSSKGRS